MKKLSDTEIMDGARDYRLMTNQFISAVLSMTEYNRFTKGIFGWVGYETKWIDFENVDRSAGKTKWNFWGLVLYSLEGITAFSTKPLVLSCNDPVYYRQMADLQRSCCGMAQPYDGYCICGRLAVLLYRHPGTVYCQGIP